MTNQKIVRRTKKKPIKEGALTLSDRDKVILLELLRSWRGVEERLRGFSAKQAAKGDYWVAAENYLFAEGIMVCAVDLAKLLSN